MSVDVDLRSSGKKARKAIANFRSATSSLDPGPDWTKGDGVDVITEDCEGNQEEQPGVEGEQGTGDIKADEEDHDRHLEQADKILKYQEEDEKKGNKEKISESLEEGTDGETVVGHELPAEPPAKVESVMSGLFDVGAYDHILEQIFTLLDGNSLAAASSTCKRWKGFIKQNLWKRPSVQESLHHFWSCHLPTFSIKVGGLVAYE